MKIVNCKLKIKRAFRWLTKTPRRKTAWVLLVAYLVNQFVYPLVPFLKNNTVHANGVIEPVALGTSLFVNRNPDFNVWFGDRLDQSKHKLTFEVGGGEIEIRLQGATEASASGEIDQLIANLRKELQKPYLTTTNGNDSIDQKIGDKATIRYEILPDRGVKESIMLQAPNPNDQIPNKFQFSMKLSNGVQLKSKLENLNDTKLNTENRTPNTEYHFTDSKGKYLANFEPLIMTDAAGAMSNDIKMDITNNILTITANQEWLNAPDRVFPIDLDPTIVHDKNPDFSSGTENRTQVTTLSAVEGQFRSYKLT